MPQQPEKLGKSKGWTKEELREIAAWFNERGVASAKCPMCGECEWLIETHPAAPPTINEIAQLRTAAFFPMVVYMCSNCTYSAFFNAITMGVFKGKETSND